MARVVIDGPPTHTCRIFGTVDSRDWRISVLPSRSLLSKEDISLPERRWFHAHSGSFFHSGEDDVDGPHYSVFSTSYARTVHKQVVSLPLL